MQLAVHYVKVTSSWHEMLKNFRMDGLTERRISRKHYAYNPGQLRGIKSKEKQSYNVEITAPFTCLLNTQYQK